MVSFTEATYKLYINIKTVKTLEIRLLKKTYFSKQKSLKAFYF